MLNKTIFGVVAAMVATTSLFAQIDLDSYKKKYPKSQMVNILKEETVKIDNVKGKIIITEKTKEQSLVLMEEAVNLFSEESIHYTSFDQVKNVSAYSYLATEKGAKKMKATNFITKSSSLSDGVFHDDRMELTFTYPSLHAGSMIDLSYDKVVSEHRFPQGFVFFTYFPVEKAVFTIDHDTSIHLIKHEYNFEGFDVKFEERLEKNRRIWTWTSYNLPRYKIDDFAPNPRFYLPGVSTQIGYYYANGKRMQVLQNLDDLVAWYTESVEEALAEVPSVALKELTASIVDGKNSEYEKVKAIYYWVQDNIKYIAFEEGMGGFVPRKANQVCEKRFGDCKDMATLIYKMLECAGIKGKIVWIGTRDIPFKYSDFPSAMVDNHMIASYEHEGKIYFLDATMDFQPMELPAYSIQNKEALVYGGRNDYQIHLVPTPQKEETVYTENIIFSIDNRKISGTAKQHLLGYYGWIIRNELTYTKEPKLEKRIKNLGELGNNSYRVTSAKFTMPESREVPLDIEFEFEVDNYVTSYQDEVYVNMILDKSIYKQKQLKSDRISPMEMDFYSTNNYINELVIPVDMKVKSLPKNVKYESDVVDFYVNYEQTETNIKVSISSIFKVLYVTKEQIKEWNDFIVEVDKALASSVVLIKK